jgi:hypothetical protein
MKLHGGSHQTVITPLDQPIKFSSQVPSQTFMGRPMEIKGGAQMQKKLLVDPTK